MFSGPQYPGFQLAVLSVWTGIDYPSHSMVSEAARVIKPPGSVQKYDTPNYKSAENDAERANVFLVE